MCHAMQCLFHACMLAAPAHALWPATLAALGWQVSVRRKLNAMPVVFAGKSVLLIDDSIVRGTTMSQIVDMVRNAGAAKVSEHRLCGRLA